MQEQINEKKNEEKERSNIAEHHPYYVRNLWTKGFNEVSVLNHERDVGVYYNLGDNNQLIRRRDLFKMLIDKYMVGMQLPLHYTIIESKKSFIL